MNSSLETYRVIDIGNTQLKIVDFQNDTIQHVEVIAIEKKSLVSKALKERQADYSILSSVLDEIDSQSIKKISNPSLFLDSSTHLPISIDNYSSKETLGSDRIANAVAANHYSVTENALVIDVGTCIKFDFISNGVYQGGSISPGYNMRLKALHHFTGKLPLLELTSSSPYLGKSTKESILSGVMNGVQAEIECFIRHYTQQYRQLTIFLTGGDHKRFDKNLKNSIFVDENLTSKGLYLVLQHNV